jgi:nucleoside-diphosphate-sugar epimerase
MNNTFHVLSICQKPFIFISSQMANVTDTTYGLLKKLGEQYSKALGGVFVRLWNVYGDDVYSKKSHVITDFIYQEKVFNHIRIKSNGQEERQFLYITDCVNCLFILSQKYNQINRKEILDVTSFAFTRIINLANILKENMPELKIETTGKYSW